MVSGTFSLSILKSFIPVFCEEAAILSDSLNKKCDPKSKDCEISYPIKMATMEMIGETAIGFKFNAQKADRHIFLDNLQTILTVRSFC